MNFIMVDHALLQFYGFTMRNCKIILAYINMEIGEVRLDFYLIKDPRFKKVQ
jgi:hypothetical protein